MNRRIYISEFNATSVNKERCGVAAKIIFKDTLTLDEIRKIKNKTFLELTDGQEKENLIKYLEDKIEKCQKEEMIIRKRRVPKFYDIGINVGEQYAYKNVLERFKSGKYE